MRVCMAQSQKYTIDFTTASESDLQDIIIPLAFKMQQTGLVHGLAFWFEVAFIGSQSVYFSISFCLILDFLFAVQPDCRRRHYGSFSFVIIGSAFNVHAMRSGVCASVRHLTVYASVSAWAHRPGW